MQTRLHRRFIPWLIAHSFEFWYYYIGALICLFSLHYFSSEIPLMAKELGDLAMGGKLAEIELSSFLFIALYILFFRTLSRLLFFYPARIQQRNLRIELVERLEQSPARNYKDYNEGMLFQTLYNDLNRLRGFVGFALLQFGNIIIAGFIFIPKIKSFNNDFLIAFSPLVGSVFGFSILVYFFQPWVKRGMDEYADVQNYLLESYDAKKTIQNYHSERDFYEGFSKISNKELRTFFISTMGRVLSFPLVKLGFGGSLIWAAFIVKNNGLAASDLIFFSSFLFLVLEPLMFVSWIGIVTSQGYAAWGRVKKLVNNLEKKIEEDWIRQNNFEKPKIPFWDKACDFSFPKNKWSVLVGETGSGKSWVLENFAQLLSEHNQKFSMIHQEPYIYSDTLIDNIFLGQEETPEKVELAKFYVKQFGLDILGSSIEEVLKMELGENGKRVSGGQAKRIALIRSLISDVDYILWDDPFSSVDLILEAQIIKELHENKKLKEITFVLTSHRLSTVKSCENVILIDKEIGIKEQGSVQELLNKKSEVNEFFEKQFA